MHIRFVGHASIVVRTADLCLWTDPWLSGKVFNDSWMLHPQPVFSETQLQDIDYLFISHEHPDHFHIPTLQALPDAFKKRVIILYQQKGSSKIFPVLKNLGFKDMRAIPHRQRVELTSRTSVYSYQVGGVDSLLAITCKETGQVILNANDAGLSSVDCSLIRRDLGKVDVLLNQFSMAGSNGPAHPHVDLPRVAQRVLSDMLDTHSKLDAKITIPFASFFYFCCEDNKFMNVHANTPRDVVNYFHQRGKMVVVLFPGDAYDLSGPPPTKTALKNYDAAKKTLENNAYDPIKTISYSDIETAFAAFAKHLHNKFPSLLLRRLKPVALRIPDIGITVEFSLSRGYMKHIEEETAIDLTINSQPLFFALTRSYGFQTLGVSARYAVLRKQRNWRLHRILFSLNSAELYLKPRYLFTPEIAHFAFQRFRGAASQILYRFQRM